MLGTKITNFENKPKPSAKMGVLNSEKRSDQWSLLLVDVGLNRSRNPLQNSSRTLRLFYRALPKLAVMKDGFLGLAKILFRRL